MTTAKTKKYSVAQSVAYPVGVKRAYVERICQTDGERKPRKDSLSQEFQRDPNRSRRIPEVRGRVQNTEEKADDGV
jgi:hypothetical protein